jgi:hypothetical protein
VPVVVTGGDLPLGRAVLAGLLAEGVPEVRATVTSRAGQRELVALGVRTAVVDWGDVDDARLGAVLAGAHTVVHLAGAPLELLASAAEGTGVRRVLLVAGAEPPVTPAGTAYEVVCVPPGPGAVAALVAADRAR